MYVRFGYKLTTLFLYMAFHGLQPKAITDFARIYSHAIRTQICRYIHSAIDDDTCKLTYTLKTQHIHISYT